MMLCYTVEKEKGAVEVKTRISNQEAHFWQHLEHVDAERVLMKKIVRVSI